jgi:hypothetical protein
MGFYGQVTGLDNGTALCQAHKPHAARYLIHQRLGYAGVESLQKRPIMPQTGRIRHGQVFCGRSEASHRGLSLASSGANDPGEKDHGSCCGRSAVCRIGVTFLAHLPSGVIGKSDLRLLRPRPVVQEAGH